MELWTVGLLAAGLVLIVVFVVWGPDLSERRGGDDGPSRAQGPYGSSDSGDGVAGGDGGAGL